MVAGVVVAEASAVVLVAVASAVAVASEARVASDQNESGNQRFVSFCKNNSDFACRYAIKVISLQAKSE
jgi:hypothetical protein